MRKFLSIFMSVVMVVTMLPNISFAAQGATDNTVNEEQQTEETKSEKDNVNPDSKGSFKYLQDKFSLFTDFLKEKAPKVWDSLKPYVDKGTNWGKDYYDNVSGFASKMGALGLITTVGLSALIVKIIWKFLELIVVWRVGDKSGQSGGCASNSSYSANSGQVTTYAYPTGGYQTPYSYMS